jgi:hypothetical protein
MRRGISRSSGGMTGSKGKCRKVSLSSVTKCKECPFGVRKGTFQCHKTPQRDTKVSQIGARTLRSRGKDLLEREKAVSKCHKFFVRLARKPASVKCNRLKAIVIGQEVEAFWYNCAMNGDEYVRAIITKYAQTSRPPAATSAKTAVATILQTWGGLISAWHFVFRLRR